MNEIDKKIENLIDQQLLDEKSINFSDQNDQQQLDFELQLQKKIDDSLSRLFPVEPTQEAAHRKKMETLISDSKSDSKSKSKLPERRRMAVRVCVLAASLMLLATMVFWQNGKDDQVAVFKRQPLVVLFEEAVDRGFQPYYVCNEPARFAEEFRRRLGVPLRLSEMPEHKKMVGIAVSGGVSRKTTAMLGKVNDEPVLVFVDNLSKDDEQMRSQVGKQTGKNGEYHVSRTEKDGLVYYEISSIEGAQLIEFFETVDQ